MSWGSAFRRAWNEASDAAKAAAADLATGCEHLRDSAVRGAAATAHAVATAATAVGRETRKVATAVHDGASVAAAWTKRTSIRVAEATTRAAKIAVVTTARDIQRTLKLSQAIAQTGIVIARTIAGLPVVTNALPCNEIADAMAGLGRQTITRQQARDAIPYAQLSSYAYDNRGMNGAPPPPPPPPPEGWTWPPIETLESPLNDPAFFHNADSNFRAVLFRGPAGQIVIAFRGTNRSEGRKGLVKDLITDFRQAIGLVPDSYKQAAILAQKARETYKDSEVVFTGHSLGGGLATYAGLTTATPVVAFNAAGLSTGTRGLVPPTAMKRNSRLVTNYNVIGDPISDPTYADSAWGVDAAQPGQTRWIWSDAPGPFTKHAMDTGVMPGLDDAAGVMP